MARSHDRNRTCDFRIAKEPSSSPPAKLMQGFRDLLPLDSSFLLDARTPSPPEQEAGPETQPSFPRNGSPLQIATLRLPKTPGKTCDTALPFGDRSLFPGKACNQFFPDAEGPGPVSQHGSSSSQTRHQ